MDKQSRESQVQIAVLQENQKMNTKEHLEIKQDIESVRKTVSTIDEKIDSAIANKADREDLNRMWYWIAGIVATVSISVIGILLNLIIKYVDK